MNREKLQYWAGEAGRLAAQTPDARLSELLRGIADDLTTIVERAPLLEHAADRPRRKRGASERSD